MFNTPTSFEPLRKYAIFYLTHCRLEDVDCFFQFQYRRSLMSLIFRMIITAAYLSTRPIDTGIDNIEWIAASHVIFPVECLSPLDAPGLLR